MVGETGKVMVFRDIASMPGIGFLPRFAFETPRASGPASDTFKVILPNEYGRKQLFN
jgi:hypothetical protein